MLLLKRIINHVSLCNIVQNEHMSEIGLVLILTLANFFEVAIVYATKVIRGRRFPGVSPKTTSTGPINPNRIRQHFNRFDVTSPTVSNG